MMSHMTEPNQWEEAENITEITDVFYQSRTCVMIVKHGVIQFNNEGRQTALPLTVCHEPVLWGERYESSDVWG